MSQTEDGVSGSEQAKETFASLFDGSKGEAASADATEPDETTEGVSGEEDVKPGKPALELFVESEQDAEEGAEEGKKLPETVPYARLQKVIGQRNDAKDEATALRLENEELGKQISEFQQFREVYKDYKDPVSQVKWDAKFMASAEALKEDQGVQAAIQQIIHHMKTGEAKVAETSAKPSSGTIARDPEVQELLRDRATEKIQSALETAGIKRELFKTFTRGIMDRAGENLMKLDAKRAIELAREVISDNGWTRDFVMAEKPEERRRRVPAGRGSGAAIVSDGEKDVKKTEAKKAGDFTNVNAFNEHQRTRFGQMVTEAMNAGRS